MGSVSIALFKLYKLAAFDLHILLKMAATQVSNKAYARNDHFPQQRNPFWSLSSTLPNQTMNWESSHSIAFFTRCPQPLTRHQYFIRLKFDS
jgi:hypothetical protein